MRPGNDECEYCDPIAFLSAGQIDTIDQPPALQAIGGVQGVCINSCDQKWSWLAEDFCTRSGCTQTV